MDQEEKLTKKERKEIKKVTEQQKISQQRKIRIIRNWGIGLLVIGLLGGGLFWIIKESNKPLPGQAVEDQGRKHVSQAEWEKFKYNSNPPTSGPHDETWVKKGMYSVPQPKGLLIHSLEHGYVELHYNCNVTNSKLKTQNSKLGTESASMDDAVWNSGECKNLIGQLKDIMSDKTDWKMIIVPNPTITTKLSVVAWDRIDVMNMVNKKEIEDFINAFRDHGPEQTMEP